MRPKLLKNARILMISRFKPGSIGGIPSVIETLQKYWKNYVQNISVVYPENRNSISLSDSWDLIIFHHPSASWITRFLDLPDDVKTKSSVIWHQLVDKKSLNLLKNGASKTIESINEEMHKRKLIANSTGVSNYAISNAVGDSIIKSKLLPKDKISVIQVPPALTGKKIQIEGFNKRGNGRFTVLVVSRISPEKGIENVLEVYSEVFKITQNASLKSSRPINFLDAGDSPNTYYNEIMTNKVKALPVNQMCSIGFLGQKTRKELAKLYENTHVLLMPSTLDSWGLVTIEALHFGIPVVAFKAPGTLEIFSKSENKIGYISNSASEAAKSIVSLMNSEEMWFKISSQSLKESIKYKPSEISLNLLQTLWNDKYGKK